MSHFTWDWLGSWDMGLLVLIPGMSWGRDTADRAQVHTFVCSQGPSLEYPRYQSKPFFKFRVQKTPKCEVWAQEEPVLLTLYSILLSDLLTIWDNQLNEKDVRNYQRTHVTPWRMHCTVYLGSGSWFSPVFTEKCTYVHRSTHFGSLQGINKQPEIYSGGSVWQPGPCDWTQLWEVQQLGNGRTCTSFSKTLLWGLNQKCHINPYGSIW